MPYFSRSKIDILPLDELIDISNECLAQMENSTTSDPDDEEEGELLLAD